MCHPSLCVPGFNTQLDGPGRVVESVVFDFAQSAGAVGNHQLGARLLVCHI